MKSSPAKTSSNYSRSPLTELSLLSRSPIQVYQSTRPSTSDISSRYQSQSSQHIHQARRLPSTEGLVPYTPCTQQKNLSSSSTNLKELNANYQFGESSYACSNHDTSSFIRTDAQSSKALLKSTLSCSSSPSSQLSKTSYPIPSFQDVQPFIPTKNQSQNTSMRTTPGIVTSSTSFDSNFSRHNSSPRHYRKYS